MVKPNSNGTDVQNSLEPSENDPCVDKTDTNKAEERKFFLRHRDNACEKWNLSYKQFYVIAGLISSLIILVIIVIALGAAWPHIPHSQRFPVCKSSPCLRVASQIRGAMNETVSPCTDLWSWACGKWLSNNPLPKDRPVWNQKQALVKQEIARIRAMIATLNLPLHVGSVEWKLKHLYEACLNVDNVNTDEARLLMNIISELGGWYILRDWNLEDFDEKAILKQLQVNYGVTPFFKITVAPDPYSPGDNIIHILPSGLGLPDKEYYYRDLDGRIQNAYKELIRDAVRYLGSTGNEAEKFGNDIFYYEKRIAEITPSHKLLQDPIKTCNHIKLSELTEIGRPIPFFEILTEMFPEANIDTEVVVVSLEYLTSISQIIATTDKHTLNGYLIWTLVHMYLPHLSDKFTSAFHSFNAELFGVPVPLKRWEMCATLVHDFMNLGVTFVDESINPISNNTKKVVSEMYNSILSVVRERLAKFKTMPDLYKQLRKKLSAMQLQIGLPRNVESAFIKDYYNKLRIIKTSFFQSVKYAIEFRRKLEERLLSKNSVPQIVIEQLSKLPPQVVYLPSHNIVTVPKSLLIEPLFEEQYPRAVIYGRLGVEIANAILSAVLPYNSFWTSDRKLLSPYHLTVNDSLKSVSTQKYCLYRYILNQNLALPYDTADETALLLLKQISAVSIANEALIAASSNDQHIHQSGLEEYDDSPLFFLSYAQTHCSESTAQFQAYENLVKFKLQQRSTLHVVWAQLSTFPDSFDCSFNGKEQCSNIF